MTSTAAVYRPGRVFTLGEGELRPLRLERVPVPELYRSEEAQFVIVRQERLAVDVGLEAPRRWPEVRGDPFRSCPVRRFG